MNFNKQTKIGSILTTNLEVLNPDQGPVTLPFLPRLCIAKRFFFLAFFKLTINASPYCFLIRSYLLSVQLIYRHAIPVICFFVCRKEMRKILYASLLRSFNYTMTHSTTQVLSFSTFMTFSALQRVLDLPTVSVTRKND